MLLSLLAYSVPTQEQELGLVYKAMSCELGYERMSGYCVQEDANISFTTKTTLMHDYTKELKEVLVHKLTVMTSNGKDVAAQVPVKIVNTGQSTISIMYMDTKTGYPKQESLSAYDSVTVESAQNGLAQLSVLVEETVDITVEVAPVWMENAKQVVITKDALHRTSIISEEQLRTLTTNDKQIQIVLDSLVSMETFKPFPTKDSTFQDIDEADIKSAKVVKKDRFFQVVVRTIKGVFQWVINSFVKAWRAITWVFAQIGKALVNVFHAVVAFFDWKDVIASHQWLEKNLLHLSVTSGPTIENNNKKLNETLYKWKGDMNTKIDSIVDAIKGKQPTPISPVDPDTPAQGQYLMTVVGQNAPMMSIKGDSSEMMGSLMILEKETKGVNSTLGDKISNAFKAIGNGVKAVSVAIVVAVIKVLQLAFNLFDDFLILGNIVLGVIIGAINKILWSILTFVVYIPFLSELHSKLTGGSKLSLLSVILLPTAALATWSYKATHWGKAPFDAQAPVVETELSDLMDKKYATETTEVEQVDRKSSLRVLEKRQVVATFLFFFFSVLITFVFLELFIKALTATIWLAVYMPFTFLAILLFLYVW